jgi:outer membrane protein assembly factor BamB/tetratricopeptide (TPR) repeat protein
MVVVTPMDAPAAYGLDARTGELRWARPRAMEVRTMYGVRDVTLVLGGEGLEFVDIRSGKLLALTGPELRGTGRGVVAEDGVTVPAADGLRRVSWDGAWENRPPGPGSGRWGGDRLRGGNLLVVDGAVVLAAHDAIEVYFDRRDQEKGILAELEKDPDNPAVLYRGALRMLQAGGIGEAEKLLGRVVERAGARSEDEPVVRAARKRLYAVRLEAGHAALEAGVFEEAAGFFERARSAAPDPASRAEASLLLGRARVAGGDVRRGIEEFQRLMAEGREESTGETRVFDLARQEIDLALKAKGREAYAPFEEEARTALRKAEGEKTAEAYLGVHRSWPNSRAAEEALLGAAAAHAGPGRTDDEIGVLRQFLREYGASSRVPEACARLVMAFERKGHKDSAMALLRRMAADFPEADVADEGGTRVTARDFAEKRLRSEAYGQPAAALRPVLSPPLRKVFDHVDRDGRPGVALEAVGTPPAAISEFLLMNTGTTVKAFDMRSGAEVWSHRTPSGVQFAAFLEDSLLLAGERNVTRVNPRDGRVEWHYVSAMPMRGFLLTGGTLCFLGTDPRQVTLPVISALDTGRGALAWSQPFQGTRKVSSDGAMLRAAGEGVAFITLEPYQIHLYDRETGKKLMAKASFPHDLAAELEYASESLAVVSSRGRFVEAYALPAGALKWRSGMSNISVRDLKVASGKVVIVGALDLPGTGPPEMTLLVLDLENGKILRMKNKIDLGDVRFMQVDGETAYFLSRERDKTIAARAVHLGDLSVRWMTALEARDATAFPLVLAKDHLAVMTFGGGGMGKFFYDGSLLDRSGRVVQNIRSGPVFERPPHAAVANDRVVFSVDNRVEVYR